MKLSEIIKRLEAIRREHGDLEAYTWNHDRSDYDPDPDLQIRVEDNDGDVSGIPNGKFVGIR